MTTIEVVGDFGSPSGYAHDARALALVLVEQQYDVTLTPVPLDEGSANYGRISERLRPLMNRQTADPDIQLIVAPPPYWCSHRRPSAYTIARTVWEADSVCAEWKAAYAASAVDEIWPATPFNVPAFTSAFSGVDIHVIPIPHDLDVLGRRVNPLDLSEHNVRPGAFVFYTIGTWIARKNVKGLVTAFLAEFTPSDNAALVIKTYGGDGSKQRATQVLEEFHAQIASGLGQVTGPPICLLLQLLSADHMLQLHARGDVGVYPTRGEGWGLPISEGMAAGNPSIVTGWSGPRHFVDHTNGYRIPYQLTPVRDMDWCRWFSPRQSWAEPNLVELRRLMRHCYENRDEVRQKGEAAKRSMQRFSIDAVGSLVKTRIDEIMEQQR